MARSFRFALVEPIANPRVVVEVLSKCTERRDRNERFGSWSSEVKRGGETVRIHGSEIAVDSIYS